MNAATIKKLQNEDTEALEQFLSTRIESSMFMLSNMKRSGLEYQDKSYHGDYFGAIDETGAITGVLAHFWNGSLMMQTASEYILCRLTSTFRQTATRPVTGILGPEDQAKVLMETLSLSNQTYTTNQAEGLHALSLGNLLLPSHIDYACTRVVEARELNRTFLTRWLRAYTMEALGVSEDKALDEITEKRIDRVVNESSCWALLVDGKPVSLSGFNAQLPTMVQIGPVWTPPEYRNRGYARTLLALILQEAGKRGVNKAILFTNNPAAAKAYEAIGFEKIGSYRLALLEKPVDLSERTP